MHEIDKSAGISRRTFLKWSTVIGGSFLVAGVLPVSSNAQEETPTLTEPSTDPNTENTFGDFIATATRAGIFTAVEIVSAPIAPIYGAPIGTRVNEEDVRLLSRTRIDGIIEAAFIPSSMELIRWIPSTLLPQQVGNSSEANLVQAVISAMIGNVKSKGVPESKPNDSYWFSNGRLPLYQVAEGYFYWNILREKGLPHSTLAHFLNNGIKLSLGRLLYRFSPRIVTSFISTTTEAMAVDMAKESVFSRMRDHFRYHKT